MADLEGNVKIGELIVLLPINVLTWKRGTGLVRQRKDATYTASAAHTALDVSLALL